MTAELRATLSRARLRRRKRGSRSARAAERRDLQLLRQALIEEGKTQDQIEFVADELAAIRRAIELAEGEDLITIMADDVTGVLAYLDHASTAGV